MSQRLELDAKTHSLLKRIALAIEALKPIEAPRPQFLKLLHGELMFIVKDNQSDVKYSVAVPSVTDAEGVVLDPQPSLSFEVASSDANVVSLTPDDPADSTKGTAHFGAPGQAAINVNVKLASDGTLLGAYGAQFTVTVGDAAAISGGGVSFEGLTEAEPTPVPEPVA